MTDSAKELKNNSRLGPKATTKVSRRSNRQNNLSILSWNIHDTMTKKEGPKSEDADFAEIIARSSIFCLQETKKEFFISNYKCYNSNRSGSRSGGVCIGVHRSILDCTKTLETGCPDFQAITLFPHDEESRFTIINVYDSPEHSSYKTKMKNGGNPAQPALTTLELVQDFIAKTQNLGEIMLLGDLNARIGLSSPVSENEYIAADYLLDGKPESYPEPNERSSKDTITNARGRLLLDFLACTGLQVLNGCVLGDALGDYTSVNYNGCSVVDYMTATSNLKDKIQSFKVMDLTKFSDHKPYICKMAANNPCMDAEELLQNLEDAPLKYKWDNEDDSIHYNFLAIQNLSEYKERISTISQTTCKTKEEVAILNGSLVKVYQDMADKLTGRKTANSHRRRFVCGLRRRKQPTMKAKSAWFDAECINAKRSLNRLAKRYGENPIDESLRDLYYSNRRTYRTLIKKKKRDFIQSLCQDIEDGRNINWGRFKKLKEMKSKGQKLDVFDMRNFCDFFKKLYGKATLSELKISQPKDNMKKETLQSDLIELLDKEITLEEVEICISTTKKRKAVSEDLISNEFLKSSGSNMRQAIVNVFNQCLLIGAYP